MCQTKEWDKSCEKRGSVCVNLKGRSCPHTLAVRQTLSSKKTRDTSEGTSPAPPHATTAVRHSNPFVIGSATTLKNSEYLVRKDCGNSGG